MITEDLNRPALIKAGIALSVVAVLANIPYGALIVLFDYDDVLRRPAGEVLELFHAGGSPLVLAWWTFALSALGFAIAAMLLGEALRDGKAKLASGFTLFGVLSGIFQAAALLRWTFAIPNVATAYVNAAEGSAERAAAVSVYESLNTFAGVGMGEHLGQLLLMVWTFGAGLALMRMGGEMKWIGAAGLATLPLWLVGQTELLSLSMPELPVIELLPYAFIGWELWLLVVGVALIVKAVGKPARSAAILAHA
ncbi:MAG TPA: DUF4386 domain-containing protein [Hyphomonadaceae bacterium]|nr:DUF4386 domain-containing protein [Hyphomonadaceae bacterium]HPN07160.1 DUF4386 domain-containing protein [Hyphomonadaceae bacterium]